MLVNDIILFLYSVITIGFNASTYTVAESGGSVNVTVNILNGTLDRDVHACSSDDRSDKWHSYRWVYRVPAN